MSAKVLFDRRGYPMQSFNAARPRLRPRTRIVPQPPMGLGKPRRRTCEAVGCFKDPFTCPMLKDSVWLTIATKRTLLCFECAEERLGRQITIDDLNHVSINHTLHVLLQREKDKHR